MWKLVDGRLIHTTDESRENCSTSVSKMLLHDVKKVAEENDTCVNYLIETGMQALLLDESIVIDKKNKSKDKVVFNNNYDRELLSEVREYAIQRNLFFNQVIEQCMRMIDVSKAKSYNNKFRVEEE